MAGEKEWRRKWKADIMCTPWSQFTSKDMSFIFKFLPLTDSYEFMISDKIRSFHEIMTKEHLEKRIQKLNPNVEVPLHKLLELLEQQMSNMKNSKVSVKFSDVKCILSLETKLAGLPFVWKFTASLCSPEQVNNHMTAPLLGMVSELLRRQGELIRELQKKDREIDDYKAQGTRLTRKHLQTTPFDVKVFQDNMATSKGFEHEATLAGEGAFSENGMVLYRELLMKNAWLKHTPDPSVEPDAPTGASLAQGGDPGSWGVQARLPGSVLSPSVSPAKSTHSSPEKKLNDAPVKDTEQMRREALELRLAEEEEKKAEQKKKKKKLKL